MLFYYKFVHTFNGILHKLCVFFIIFVATFSLSTFAMEKDRKHEENLEIGISSSLNTFVNTVTVLARVIEAFQTALNPPVDIQTSAGTAAPSLLTYKQAIAIISECNNHSSLFSRAREFTGTLCSIPGILSGLPGIKTTDYNIMMESMVLAAMQIRPQYFECIATGGPIADMQVFVIGFSFLKEFIQKGPLDGWLAFFQQKVEANEPEGSARATLEFSNSVANVMRCVMDDPSKNLLNKYVAPEDIKNSIKLREWLEQNPDHEEYNVNVAKLIRLDDHIRARRNEAAQEGGEYLFSTLKCIDQDFASMEDMSEIIYYHEKKSYIRKRKDFESFILEKYEKSNTFDPNFLLKFWETLERNQYGKVCYKIVCESFERQHKDSLLHQIVQQIWLTSQLDTMNEYPKEARSRMPGASFDGISAPNFGYAMGRSDAYQAWITNSLVRASGDIIMDAYHSMVDFGSALDVNTFLGRFNKHLSDKIDYFRNPHEYDKFMRPFELYLLERVFVTPFVYGNGRTISDELIKAAGNKETILEKARVALNQLNKFSINLLALRPSNDKSKGLEKTKRFRFWYWF